MDVQPAYTARSVAILCFLLPGFPSVNRCDAPLSGCLSAGPRLVQFPEAATLSHSFGVKTRERETSRLCRRLCVGSGVRKDGGRRAGELVRGGQLAGRAVLGLLVLHAAQPRVLLRGRSCLRAGPVQPVRVEGDCWAALWRSDDHDLGLRADRCPSPPIQQTNTTLGRVWPWSRAAL